MLFKRTVPEAEVQWVCKLPFAWPADRSFANIPQVRKRVTIHVKRTLQEPMNSYKFEINVPTGNVNHSKRWSDTSKEECNTMIQTGGSLNNEVHVWSSSVSATILAEKPVQRAGEASLHWETPPPLCWCHYQLPFPCCDGHFLISLVHCTNKKISIWFPLICEEYKLRDGGRGGVGVFCRQVPKK